jgi:3-methyladenine DNA glycosylase AlkD
MEDAKAFSAAAPGMGGDGFRHGTAFDLRELGGVFALMGLATKDDIREIREAAKSDNREIRAEFKAEIREVRVELNSRIDKLDSRIDKLDSRIDKVQEELHGIKGLVAKWLIGTIIAVIGTMIAQTTLILSAVRLPG